MLHELGFRRLRATGLKRKHVNALVAEWQRRGLAVGTVKNRMSALRWWAGHVGRPGVVGTNAAHGIGERRYVHQRRQERGPRRGEARAGDRCARADVARAPGPRSGCGARRRSSSRPPGRTAAIGCGSRRRGRRAGGRARFRSGTSTSARCSTRPGASRAAGRRFRAGAATPRTRKVYEKQTEAAGLSRMHGLRHAYAQARYEALTGWKAPVAGGPRRRSLGPAKRRIDKAARMTIARELGHGRLEIVPVYLGS